MSRRPRPAVIVVIACLAAAAAASCSGSKSGAAPTTTHPSRTARTTTSTSTSTTALVTTTPATTTTTTTTSVAVDEFVGRISSVDEARLGLSWRPGCPVAPSDLRLLTLSFRGYDGENHVGELIVNRTIATALVGVFRSFWNERFPINRMETSDKFLTPADFRPDGTYIEKDVPDTIDDTASFNCRQTTGSSTWSQHAYGLAIDINPRENPYLKGTRLLPTNGLLARDASVPGTIVANSFVVRTMKRAGFSWGGYWTSLKDYQHFSTNNR